MPDIQYSRKNMLYIRKCKLVRKQTHEWDQEILHSFNSFIWFFQKKQRSLLMFLLLLLLLFSSIPYNNLLYLQSFVSVYFCTSATLAVKPSNNLVFQSVFLPNLHCFQGWLIYSQFYTQSISINVVFESLFRLSRRNWRVTMSRGWPPAK